MARDALAAHAREELGISAATTARPVQAALTSAASFTVGAALPLATVMIAPAASIFFTIATASLALLAFLGIVAAAAGGAPIWPAAARVTFWGALAMGATAAAGHWLGSSA
jgi:VIT1/CCC1 family predicted Fe2+/Mn2+ transporter